MTAHRNGRFRRAALRLVTVAGFAAAAWFTAHAAAHAAERPETPIDPARSAAAQHSAPLGSATVPPSAAHSSAAVQRIAARHSDSRGGSAHRGPAQGSGGPMTVPARTLTAPGQRPLLRALLGGEAGPSDERDRVPRDDAGTHHREDRVGAPDLITSLLRVSPGLGRQIGVQRVVMGVDAVLSSPATALTNEADSLLTAVLRPVDPDGSSTDDTRRRIDDDGAQPNRPRTGPPPVDHAPLLQPIADLTAACDSVLAATVQAARPLLEPVVTTAEPLVATVVQVLSPISLLADTVSTHLIQPVVHALTGAAAPALSAVPVGVLPSAPPATAEAAARDQADLASPAVVRPAPARGRTLAAVRAPDAAFAAAAGQAHDGFPGRTPGDWDSCTPGGTPASSVNNGAGAPSATLADPAPDSAGSAATAIRSAEHALRRADAPRPTSSPD